MPSGVYQRRRVDPQQRFWSKVAKGECWLWTAGTNQYGYGLFWTNGKMVAAHRFAYEVVVGPIPEGMDLDHRLTCPKNCVNPLHLRPATRKQNMENAGGLRSTNTSGVHGVSWFSRDSRWRAQVKHHGKVHHVGYFDTIEAAESAVIAKRIALFTHNDADRMGISPPL